jgi:hypothetical protein
MLTIIERMKAAKKAVRHATHFESIVVPDSKHQQDINYVGTLLYHADENICR